MEKNIFNIFDELKDNNNQQQIISKLAVNKVISLIKYCYLFDDICFDLWMKELEKAINKKIYCVKILCNLTLLQEETLIQILSKLSFDSLLLINPYYKQNCYFDCYNKTFSLCYFNRLNAFIMDDKIIYNYFANLKHEHAINHLYFLMFKNTNKRYLKYNSFTMIFLKSITNCGLHYLKGLKNASMDEKDFFEQCDKMLYVIKNDKKLFVDFFTLFKGIILFDEKYYAKYVNLLIELLQNNIASGFPYLKKDLINNLHTEDRETINRIYTSKDFLRKIM